MFETSRLRLRELRKSDLSSVLAMFNTYEIQESSDLAYTVPNGDEYIERWEKWALGCIFLGIIEEKESASFIGVCTLRMDQPRNRDAEMSICVVKNEWGKGYGTEVVKWLVNYAFMGMNFHRVSLNVFKNNERAVKLYESVGFKVEGCKRGAKWQDGKWVDGLMMGIVEEEYIRKVAD